MPSAALERRATGTQLMITSLGDKSLDMTRPGGTPISRKRIHPAQVTEKYGTPPGRFQPRPAD